MYLSLNDRKRTFWHTRLAQIRISVRIHAVWSETSLSVFGTAENAKFLLADSKVSDQTARMHRLIWVFVWCTYRKVRFRTIRLFFMVWNNSVVLVFFSLFSIAITSLGEERANHSDFRTFDRFVLLWICRFPLPLGIWEGLRFVIVALPGLFSYLFWLYQSWLSMQQPMPYEFLVESLRQSQ